MEIVISKLPLFADGCFECVKQLLFDYTRCEICGCVSMLKKVGDKNVCYKCKDWWKEYYCRGIELGMDIGFHYETILPEAHLIAFKNTISQYIDGKWESCGRNHKLTYETADEFEKFAVLCCIDKTRIDGKKLVRLKIIFTSFEHIRFLHTSDYAKYYV